LARLDRGPVSGVEGLERGALVLDGRPNRRWMVEVRVEHDATIAD
jgi:hypothetical protein